MNEQLLSFAVIATFVFAFGVISKRLQTTCITGPIVFVIFGYLLSGDVTGLVASKNHVLVYIIANITLILILFSDASRISLSLFREEQDLPRRLLGIGLPLTICFGTICAVLLFTDLPFWQAAVLSATLAPTDAALAQAVINSKRVPQRISEALNVESGLNDGICFPFLLMFLSIADISTATSPWSYWVKLISFQLILGSFIGAVIGFFGGKLTLSAVEKKWMTKTFQRLSMVAISFMAFCFSDLMGGNGFIAAFFAGLIFGHVARGVLHPIHDFGESVGELFILLTFMLFGAILVPFALAQLTGKVIVYAFLSLTVVRIVPVALSLIGKGLSRASVIYLGWFGPRGAASILYLIVVVEQYQLSEEKLIFDATTITVLSSIMLHGLTAVWGSNLYGRKIESTHPDHKMQEMKAVTASPTRMGKQAF